MIRIRINRVSSVKRDGVATPAANRTDELNRCNQVQIEANHFGFAILPDM
jgi:hypothetical protein